MSDTGHRRASGFAGALQFLTRVPVRIGSPPDLTRSVPWFPVIGTLLGGMLAAILVGVAELVPMPVAAVVAVLLGVLVTGAFHEDGLADVADAFAGGWDREQRFRILTDPLHGSYGVAAMSGTILVRATCLAVLTPAAAAVGLVTAHTLGRGAAVATMATVPTAKPGGLGADYTRSLRPGPAAVGVAFALGATAVVSGWWAGPLVAAAVVGALVVGALAVAKLGGVTGDVLGAVEQVTECLVLVTLTALATRHPVWWR